MTVETTSFLSSAKITSNGSEKSAKFLKGHKNLIIFLLAVILVLFCVSASILQVPSIDITSADLILLSILAQYEKFAGASFIGVKNEFRVSAGHEFFALHKSIINFLYAFTTWESNFTFNTADMDTQPHERHAAGDRSAES